ncbi:MAG: hypothetical protein ACLGIM_13750, partial [Alphaproteobacteria bacterium]
MMAHTPGPWHIGKAVNGNWIEAGSELMGHKSIARTFCGDVGYLMEDANARLIAAAPDMLEALRKARGLVMVSDHTSS